ncbi:MAG: lactate racemase domain-containing protein, partial [Bacillota bacterium]
MIFPRIYNVRQVFPREKICDIVGELNTRLEEVGVRSIFSPGERVAIAVGSRGIANISKIISVLVEKLKVLGTNPFIVPAMGSHGGATAQGQVEVLASLGITEETVGAPIVSDMEVVELGKTGSGATVYMDKNAWLADA